jgi:hypothetical protein
MVDYEVESEEAKPMAESVAEIVDLDVLFDCGALGAMDVGDGGRQAWDNRWHWGGLDGCGFGEVE